MRVCTAVLAACLFVYGARVGEAMSEDVDQTEELQTVVVTGSLIPQSESQTTIPVSVITSDDMQARGQTSVAQALQQSSFATGSFQGPQTTNGFTPGAQTLSLFGLSPSYVKYLIDGRPMSNYPALYGASDVIVSVTGIPQVLVDHIDVLPGGQSSLYGSDAIAGVINVILKKQLEAPLVDLRYGFYQDGGGVDKRIALADGLKLGSVNILAGAQYEKTEPIWGYQRSLTASRYAQGSLPVKASYDYVVYSAFGPTDYFLDPNECGRATSQFGGTLQKFTVPSEGSYCGTTRSGFSTLDNGEESVQLYLHATGDLSTRTQLYVDSLLSHEVTTFSMGPGFWGSYVNSDAFYDPDLDDLVNMQRLFSPEEIGGLDNSLNKLDLTAFRATLGLQGSVGESGWTYDVSATHTQETLIKHTHVLFSKAVEDFFGSILGPDLGPDPYYGVYPTYRPDYATFYTPLTPVQYASFSGMAESHSQTSDNLIRVQLTQPSLFALPGGSAGIALVGEGGNETWSYIPDAGYLNGAIYGLSAVAGSGHRTRQAITGELRLPLLPKLNLTASTRYDNYRVSGDNVHKTTFATGLQFRPVASVVLRARYGTSFKAPTLADEYQGVSGGYSSVTDYYQCALQGYAGTNIGNCPQYLGNYFTPTSGSLKLKPITAHIWSSGLAWSPREHLAMSADLLNWKITNEVAEQDPDQVLKTEAACRLGTYDINSATCQAALAQVTRDAIGMIQSVFIPRVNVSREELRTFIANVHYGFDIARAGSLTLEASWTDLLKHSFQLYPTDPVIDELRDPLLSTDFKSKINGSVTWKTGSWSSTAYVLRYGRSPNYQASSSGYGTPAAAALPPWTLCNWSAAFQWTHALALSFAIDNVFNKMPPADHTYPGSTSQPYNPNNYNVYGRSYLLALRFEPRI